MARSLPLALVLPRAIGSIRQPGTLLNVISPIAFGVGAIGLGAGAYLFLTSKRDAPRRTGALDVQPHVSPALTGLSLTRAF
ncbi:MAG TPA: hypothetical protein VM925_08940 [Labilithrix sp.]|nr:hypothetical protein [Labilithrix sp.]